MTDPVGQDPFLPRSSPGPLPWPPDELSRSIMLLIGGLNGRRPFFEYLKRKAGVLLRQGAGPDDIAAMVKAEHRFWSGLLRSEMKAYDGMRNEDGRMARRYAFIHYEFDDLFRYYKDPLSEFGIDLKKELTDAERAALVASFGNAIVARRGFVWTLLPLSFLDYFWKLHFWLFFNLGGFLLYYISGGMVLPPRDKRAFDWSRNGPLAHVNALWKGLILFGITVNVFAAVSLYRIVAAMALPGVEVVLLCLLQCFLLPVSMRSFIQLARIVLAFYYTRIKDVGPVKSWRHVRQHFSYVWDNAQAWHRAAFKRMIQDMLDDKVLTPAEFSQLQSGGPPAIPANENARYRIRRWLNKFYHLKRLGEERPVSWDETKSLTVIVFSLGEKFFYSIEELVESRKDPSGEVISILTQLRRSYRDEWQNLVESLGHGISGQERKGLLQQPFCLEAIPSPAVAGIERWANMRIQTLYNTLESMKELEGIYARIAAAGSPALDEKAAHERARGKLQIILLHDKYPAYAQDSRQKQDIDRYMRANPGVELHWPKDLLHPSKYGSLSNIVPCVRGEILLLLDSDHHADSEELAYLPHLFRIFDRDPQCAAVGFRLYAFNEGYNNVTHLASLSNNAWWVHDLRIKALIGAGGVYGKMLLRSSALLAHEFIQPDSVAEDMLAMTRLTLHGAGIQFSEIVAIGQGEDVSFYGLRNKFGRYPVGAIESVASKLYQEMLYSPDVPLYSKLESIFMLSYYPALMIIAAAHFLILAAWAAGFKILSVFPLSLLLISYIAINLVDSLYVLVHMYEREGVIRGTKRYLETLLPMIAFHGGYFYHYLEQQIKAVKGYSRFNISEKKYAMVEEGLGKHYLQNKTAFNLGSLGLGLFAWGMVFHAPSRADVWAMAPFVFSSFIWGFSALFFVARKGGIWNLFDISGEIVFVIVRSYVDILLWPFGLIRSAEARS